MSVFFFNGVVNMIEKIVDERVIRAFVTFMAYFGTRFIAADVQTQHVDILNSTPVKILTLFCIFMQATNNTGLSISLTAFALVVNYALMSFKTPIPPKTPVKTNASYQQAPAVLNTHSL